ncbi:MAG TPA: hypothetical protein VGQ59_10425 [Cyclobacteriaceae bacterium]|jgi:hypothetical protein|nr:hypothetical protein [Cyclobacteriaceae bacterium]
MITVTEEFSIGVFVTSNVSRAHFTDDKTEVTFCGLNTTDTGHASSETRFIFEDVLELQKYIKSAPEEGSVLVEVNWNLLCKKCKLKAEKLFPIK